MYLSRTSSYYFQGFAFAYGLASLALLQQGMKDKSSDGVFYWNVTGASICYLDLEVRLLSQSCMKAFLQYALFFSAVCLSTVLYLD